MFAGALLLAAGGVTAAIVATRADDGSSAAARPQDTVTREVTVEEGPTTVMQTVMEPAAVSVEQAAELNDEAFGLMQDGEWAEALPLLERAVPALEGTYSDDFRYEAYAEYNLGRTLAALERCDEARGHLDRSKQLQGNREEIKAAKRLCAPGQRA